MECYVVDAFAERIFEGNPAAVCVMDTWISENAMQKIAIENNLSETAFCVKEGSVYYLRWFTPGGEVDLCGHATLATAYVITSFVEPGLAVVQFVTLSGVLTVTKEGDLFAMDFPSYKLQAVPVTKNMGDALGILPIEAYIGEDLICVLENEQQVRSVIPKQDAICKLDGVALHITAKGKNYDCVTRTFAPKCNISEDPVCGRAHCHIALLWAEKLSKSELVAYQASSRGGILYCSFKGARTILRGKAVLYSKAKLFI